MHARPCALVRPSYSNKPTEPKKQSPNHLVCVWHRYKLLLTELLKHTPAEHPDYADLCAAVQLVSGVVNSINEDIKRQEKRFKVLGNPCCV